jgi:hypothetical protein
MIFEEAILDAASGSAESKNEGENTAEASAYDGAAEREVPRAPPIECKLQLTAANPGSIKLTSVDLKANVVLTESGFERGVRSMGLAGGSCCRSIIYCRGKCVAIAITVIFAAAAANNVRR